MYFTSDILRISMVTQPKLQPRWTFSSRSFPAPAVRSPFSPSSPRWLASVRCRSARCCWRARWPRPPPLLADRSPRGWRRHRCHLTPPRPRRVWGEENRMCCCCWLGKSTYLFSCGFNTGIGSDLAKKHWKIYLWSLEILLYPLKVLKALCSSSWKFRGRGWGPPFFKESSQTPTKCLEQRNFFTKWKMSFLRSSLLFLKIPRKSSTKWKMSFLSSRPGSLKIPRKSSTKWKISFLSSRPVSLKIPRKNSTKWKMSFLSSRPVFLGNPQKCEN